MVDLYDILKHPVITEKTALNTEKFNKYCFVVNKNANKNDLKTAVQNLFNVEVVSVNIINTKPRKKTFRGKKGVVSGYKKALITLKKGQSIDYSAGVK